MIFLFQFESCFPWWGCAGLWGYSHVEGGISLAILKRILKVAEFCFEGMVPTIF